MNNYPFPMKIERRIALEKRIVRRLVRDLLAAGYSISVNNGGDENEIPYSRDYSQIAAALFATDDEHLLTRRPDGHNSFVYLVYGNDGYDVVNDYGTSLEPMMGPINEWCDRMELRG
jgi:hypothetical protein